MTDNEHPLNPIINNNSTVVFANFSKAYYVGRLYIHRSKKDHATIQTNLHEGIIKQLHSDTETTQPNIPLRFKIGSTHFLAIGDKNTPGNTIELPPHILEKTNIQNPPTLKEILLEKPKATTFNTMKT